MQEINSLLPQDDDSEAFRLTPEMIDLLVDGELPEQERRLLLKHLDQTTNGWKDCAIAFLEAAMFREALTSQKNEDADHKNQPASLRNSSYEHLDSSPNSRFPQKQAFSSFSSYFNRYFSRNTVTAMLGGSFFAFFLSGIAFFIFFTIDRPNRGNFSIVPGETVAVHAGKKEDARGFGLINTMDPLNTWGLLNMASSNGGVVHPNAPLRYVTLHSGNPDFQGVPFPCYSAKSVNPATYLATFSTIQKDEIQQLRNAGHEVDVHRQNIVVPDSDGRRVVIPVDQVNIKYRSRARYQ